MYLTLIFLGVVLGSWLLSWGLCKSAARGDRQIQRIHAERLAMQNRDFMWPQRRWPGQ